MAATTTTPRKRTTRTTTAKPAAAKTAAAKPAEAPAPAEDADLVRVGPFELDANGETKSYAKFSPPADSGCVGTLYVPLGTEQVRVVLYGPAETE